MAAHVDILEQRDSLATPFLVSVAAHAALFTVIALYTQVGRGRIQWGTPHSLGGGAAAINAVSQIPLPTRSGLVNPVANDTESRVPAPPKPQPRTVREPPPDAIPLRSRKAQPKKPTYMPRYSAGNYRTAPDRPNQLYGGSGQALASTMFGAQTGTGGVGIGPGSAFGQRYGWYRDLLERKIAQNWHTEDVDSRLQTAPPVIVTFQISRNGTAGDIKILQGSGNYALDNSARRAIAAASPFQPLPNDYPGGSVQIEIWFQLKR